MVIDSIAIVTLCRHQARDTLTPTIYVCIIYVQVGGIKLEDPSCVRKTVPSFFQILAAPPPRGLGAEVPIDRDG